MTAKKSEATKHLGLRIPIPLHQALTGLARREDRSLSNLIMVVLKEAVQKRRK